MRRILLLLMLVLVPSSPARALVPTTIWSRAFGDGTQQYGRAVAIDASGNSYFAGDFQGTVNLGGGNLSSLDGYDMYLVKFDALGNHLWSQRFGGTGDQHAMSLAIDPSGNVYLGGYFAGQVNLGDAIVTSAGLNDVFLAKYGPSGNLIWRARRGDAQDQMLQSVATDSFGNVIFAGSFSGTLSLVGANLVSAGGSDMFVAQYNSTGAYMWGKRFGDATDQLVTSMSTDPSDNVLLLGDFSGTVNFGEGDINSVGATDIILAKFNTSGVFQWYKQYGTASPALSRSVATDSSGNVFIGGIFLCCINFGGGPLSENGGAYDIFVAKLGPAGNYLWSKDFGDDNTDDLSAIATDYKGDVYLYGGFRGQVDFGGGPLVGTPGAILEPFLAVLDSFGNHGMSTFFPGGPVATTTMACFLDEVCVTGAFSGTLALGGGLTSSGNNDIYAARLSRFSTYPVIQSIVDVGHDQGKKVWIEVKRSRLDGPTATHIDHYEFYRRPEPAARSAATEAPGNVAVNGWDLVGSIPAHGEDEYLAIAPTLVDSTITQGQHYTAFFARAVTNNPLVYFDSPPDSGYSLDNLAPAVPANLIYQAGLLSWSKSKSSDFDHFAVYGSNTSLFESAVLINATASNSMDVSASPYVYYFVTATDDAGNESAPAGLATLTAVGDTPRSYVLSISAYPNPFNPQTTLRYTLPSKGRVAITIYDTRGALVAKLIDETRNAGAYAVPWNGQNDSGRIVSSGVYYAHITVGSQARSCKLLLMK